MRGRGLAWAVYGLWMHLRGFGPRTVRRHPLFEITNRPRRLLWIGLALTVVGLIWVGLIIGGNV